MDWSVSNIHMKAVVFRYLVGGNRSHKSGRVVFELDAKSQGKKVRVCGAKRWAQVSGIIDTCACRYMLVVISLMDFVNTLGLVQMRGSFRGSRIGCKASTIKEVIFKS